MAKKPEVLSLKEADILIGRRRVLDKITVISNLLKKKKKKENKKERKSYNTLELNPFTDKCSLINSDSRWMEDIFLQEIKLKRLKI